MSKKIVYSVIASILALVVVGCALAEAPELELVEREAPVEIEAVVVDEEQASAVSGYGTADFTTIERLIVRNASLDLVVPDTEAALDEINDLVDELGGYIVESSVDQYREGLQAHVTLRIPAESLDVALDHIRDLATEVRSEHISGQDVTKDYVGFQSRLRYLEATEARLLEFLEEAEDTEAALAVYEQLREIQADIEQVKGQVQYLEQSAAMAMIRLEITPDELAQPIQVAGWNLKGAWRDAVENLVAALQFLVEDVLIPLVGTVIPVLIVIAAPFVGLFFLVRAIVRWRRARKAS